MERDTGIYELNNVLKMVDSSSLTNLGNTNSNILDILSNRISTVTDSASDDNWNDLVKSGIKDSILKITSCIEHVKKSCTYIVDAKKLIDNLKELCNKYVTEYDNYEKIGPEPSMYKMKNGNILYDEDEKPIRNQDYANYMIKKKAFESSLPQLKDEVYRVKDAVQKYFSAIDLTTNTIDGSLYVAGSGDIRFDYEKYFNERSAIVFEGWVNPPSVTKKADPIEKTVEEHKEGDYERKFVDGSKIDAKRTEDNTFNDVNGNGDIDAVDEQIHQEIHEEGTFTDKDDNVYDYLHDEESDTIGLVSSSTTLKDNEENVVFDNEQNRIGGLEGVSSDSLSYVEGEEVTHQNGQSTHTRTITYYNSDMEKAYSYTVDDNDPSCGECTTLDGKTYRYYRKDGKLYEKLVYFDEDGNQIENAGLERVHNPFYGMFTVTDINGDPLDPPVSIKVDMESQIDRLKVQSYMDNANLKCGFYDGKGGVSFSSLSNPSGNTMVYNSETGEGYNFNIDYNYVEEETVENVDITNDERIKHDGGGSRF